ncbi:S-layer homology domain-containing protein [Paenibacillus piri]|uniref:S-layer homology domain-containing protein n=1 Tax=Paenibacillus piri TaxID=2547395 RepID=A0A4R5KI90_9BACL|nr:S-layer homology domain-containing protein [Paenibacillus piri]TDF94127.1 S-layer homology domain-containing protein [Paenibacillus piri]
MINSKLHLQRMRRNRLKLLFAAIAIACMRKMFFLTGLIALPVAMFSSSGAAAAESSKSDEIRLSDIAGHWAEQPIREAVSSGAASGYADGSFKPDRNVSGKEFAGMLTASLQIPLLAPASGSKQASGEIAPDPSVQSLQEAGLVRDGEFRRETLDQALQRSQMMALALRAIDPDAADTSPEAVGGKAAAAGLMESEPEDQAALARPATRAEAVVVLQRLKRLLGFKQAAGS